MGSRIHLSLKEASTVPSATVSIETIRYSDVDAQGNDVQSFSQMAVIQFPSGFEFTFDLHFDKGVGVLSSDFNFFRYAPTDSRVRMMRELYENGICFEVIH